MSVSIRLSRVGTKHVPFFRVVVVDSRKKRDGKVLENIGTYDGLKTKLVMFKPERYDAWIKLGAQPSDTAKKLYRLFKKSAVTEELGVAPKKKVAKAKQGESVEQRTNVEKKSESFEKDDSQE